MNLTDLQHSAFLQSLGWAIANSLWQAGILWLAYHFINASYKNASSKFKTNLGTALLFSTFVWFTISFFQKFFLLKNETVEAQISQFAFTEYVPSKAFFSWQIFINKAVAVLPYLSMAYLFLLVLLALRLINSYRYIYFIKANGLEKPGVEWRLFADKVANHIGITKKIKIWLSQHIDVPATIGFLKPVILIPVASVNQLSVQQLEAVILHELSHIKRNDYLINLFISLIETVLFFNPFVVLLSKIIKRERENCCDDFVIQYQYDRHAYASALLSLEQGRNKNLRLALTATSGKKVLLYRIKRIMEIKSKNTSLNYGQKLLALLLITGIICSIAWLSPDTKQNTAHVKKHINKTLPEKEKSDNKTKNIFTTIIANINKNIPANIKTKKAALREINNENLSTPDEAINSAGENERTEPFLQNNESDTLVNSKELYEKFNAYEPGNTPEEYAANVQLLRHLPSQLGIEKIRSQLEKINFSFSFDVGKIQQEIKKNLKNLQWDDAPGNVLKKQVDEKIGKLFENEVEILKQKKIRQHNRLTSGKSVQPLFNKKFLLLTDSLRVASLAMVNAYNDNSKFFERKFSGDDPFKNATEIARQKLGNTYGKFYEYKTDVSNNSHRAESSSNPVTLLRHGKINVECKNGAVYVNGRKIKMPEASLINRQSKSKKIIITTDNDNDIMEIRVDN